MESVIPKSNGTYLIRVSCGLDGSGKQITRSKTFKPSKPNLSYQKLNKEIDQFVAGFELEVKSGGKGVSFDKNIFRHINGKRIVFSLKIIGRFFHIFRCVIFVPKLIMAILFGWKSHI